MAAVARRLLASPPGVGDQAPSWFSVCCRSRGQPGGCSDACAASARGPRCAAVEIAVLLSKMRKRNPILVALARARAARAGAPGGVFSTPP